MSDPQDGTERTAREWWNSWANHFQSEYGDGEIPVGIAFGPGAEQGDDLGLLGELDGVKAIELGCGGAQFGIGVSKRGADVTGVDISEEQLAFARSLADEHDQDIEFVESSVTEMPTVASETYDIAFSAFAFQWVRDLEACFAEAYRVLKEDGKLVFSVDHPYYKTLDAETGEFERSYFSDEPRRVYSEEFDAEMVIYSRGVGETVSLLTDVGFTVEAIREPGYEDPDCYESEYGSFAPELMATVPPTIVYSARK
ncbi:type 11 methyltransferase [Haladaptatus paucihalophilus DX253]|uniref:Methyltransferase domain-containing protein n=1 Tax=Haladaptatus paucihalophilus DX253 TaxID=797209 RepID=E7QV99_HALPU|nr:class I SAM-dependent methyltransferase [Haladaptatus paucihalophilus]EFW91617.1 type 11 methyltransferase [Haladaptatus paucihalophilus DX253]SHL22821.1 Methyltransferase domain-containing protein [Haladaptatus paucihalophilus DX253]